MSAEQILEHALHLHYGASRGSDLSYRVLARWKAGDTGDALPIERSAVRWAWFAAVVVFVASALFMALPPPSQVLVVLEHPVQIVRGPDWLLTDAAQIREGDTVILNDQPLELEFRGNSLTLQPETLATFHETGLRLRVGAVQVTRAQGEPIEIETSLLTVQVGETARLAMQIIPRETGETEMTFSMLAKQLYLHTAPATLVLAVTLSQGTARVESDGGSFLIPLHETLQQAWIEEQGFQGTTAKPVPVEDPATENPALAFLMKEVGTWDVEVIASGPYSQDAMDVKVVEVGRAGPGGAWLISDMTVTTPMMEGTAHWVTGIDADDPEKYIGSVVSTIGPGPGLQIVEGTFDGSKRIMHARQSSGTGIVENIRMVYSWISDDERIVVSEQKDGENWIKTAEFRYKRRT